MKRLIPILQVGLLLFVATLFGCNANKYESVSNDPMKVRIYTLDNGLKIYMSVNKDAPKVNAYIVVKAGGKNDPANATGLAHYFEHMMFKGTSKFGSKDWTKEKPLLDQIEGLFEVYRNKTDDIERKAIYHQIDSVSQVAAQYAIANEYDKLMAAIGSTNSNAMTDNDYTAYTETIPANQMENWATIQAERFREPILRLFHTELETVYEEFNMGQGNDDEKAYDALMNGLFPHHPYGTQTVIGKGEHLKNPSMKSIKEYYQKNYVPNNMAIVLVGDFDPEKTIALLKTKFGSFARKEVAPLTVEQEVTINQPVVKTVMGQNTEKIYLGFRIPKNDPKNTMLGLVAANMLYNGQAGLLDLNINQKQLALESYASFNEKSDYNFIDLSATPIQGQKLEDLKGLVLEQVKKMGNGQVDEKLFKAVVTNLKLEYEKQIDNSYAVTQMLMESFIYQKPWSNDVTFVQQLESITLKEVITFAQQYLADGYVVVYKKQGEDKSIQKISKPTITPITINRTDESEFLKQIRLAKVEPISPVFPNLKKDINIEKSAGGLEVVSVPNTTNQLFHLVYLFDFGYGNDRDLKLLNDYAPLIGTATLPAAELKSQLYALGSSIGINVDKDEINVSVSGLNENMEATLKLVESYFREAKTDESALKSMVENTIKDRADSKTDFNRTVDAAYYFCRWGSKSAETDCYSNDELKNLKAEILTQKFRNLFNYKHKIAYYGPDKNMVTMLNSLHPSPKAFTPTPTAIAYPAWNTTENKLYILDFDNKQAAIYIGITDGAFDKNRESRIRLFNEYFGGGMNSIVFQELREARGLAYSAMSYYQTPIMLKYPYYNSCYIATQNDKTFEAMAAFDALLTNLPKSENAFMLAKNGIISRLESNRYVKTGLIGYYFSLSRLGLTEGMEQQVYSEIKKMTYADILKFHQQYIKGKVRTTIIVGKEKEINLKALEKFGKIERITLKDVYGY